MTTQPNRDRRNPAETRRLFTEAVLLTLRSRELVGTVVELPEGEEIEVPCAPLIAVPGARFFLRVETDPPRPGADGGPRVPVAAAHLASWRSVPEPVAVVALDPVTGVGRVGAIHPFLAELDRRYPGWEDTAPSVLVPVPEDLDGPVLRRLAREAADEHVLFRRVLESVRALDGEPPPANLQEALARLRQTDFAFTVACVDLLRETGMLVEDAKRALAPAPEVAKAFARAAVHHGVGARGHLDPAVAKEAGQAAVVRVVLSRLPGVAEDTATRCAVVLSRFLPVEDTEAILFFTGDLDSLARVLAGEKGDAGEGEGGSADAPAR